MKLAVAPSSGWLTSKPFRFLLLLLGIGLFIVFGLMLFVVTVNLPYSWIGLLAVIVGFSGAAACFRYFRNQRLVLLIPILVALLMITVFLVVVLIFGDRFDEELQRYKLQSNQTETKKTKVSGCVGAKPEERSE